MVVSLSPLCVKFCLICCSSVLVNDLDSTSVVSGILLVYQLEVVLTSLEVTGREILVSLRQLTRTLSGASKSSLNGLFLHFSAKFLVSCLSFILSESMSLIILHKNLGTPEGSALLQGLTEHWGDE